MRRVALLLFALAVLEACNAPRVPRILRGGGGGNDGPPRGEQGSGQEPAPTGDPRPASAPVGGAAQEPREVPPLGSARPPRAPRPAADVDLPPPSRRAAPDWLQPGTEGKPGFQVDFGGDGRRMPSGLHAGMNDLLQADAGCWQVWGDGLPEQRAGLLRLWLRYHTYGLNREHVRTARMAADAGLSVFLTVVGHEIQEGRVSGEDAKETLDPVESAEDIEAWAQRVAADVAELRAAGVDVRYVEIWNEPDYAGFNWGGTQQSFADFFARSGRRLRELLPTGIRIGGPGMGSGSGGGMRLFRLMLEACVKRGFEPDFLSWHQYGGMPTDQELAAIPAEIRRLVDASGLVIPELILSEWNLTMPVNPALEDHRAAANFAAMVISMARTELSHAMYFFLKDGFWESEEDYDGRSLGMITVHGAPKAVLAGARLVRRAAEMPMVPVTRIAAPNNLALMATREGGRGLVLAANAGGRETDTAQALAESMGVDITDYKGKEATLQRFLQGNTDWQAVRGPAADRPAWEAVRRYVQTYRAEMAKSARTVRVRLRDVPDRIGRVWLIDASHGNPKASAEIQQAFAPYRQGTRLAAAERARAALLAQGIPAAQVDALERGMREDDAEALRSVPPEVRRLGQRTFEAELEEIKRDLTPRLASMEDAFAAEVPAAGRAALQDGVLTLQLPVGTTLLVEVLW